MAVNLWSAFNYLFPEGTWGAFPGRFSPAAPSTEADGVGSGNGVVGNALALDGVQKSVLRAELASPVTDMMTEKLIAAESCCKLNTYCRNWGA